MTAEDAVYAAWLNLLGSDEIADTTPAAPDIAADLHRMHERAEASHTVGALRPYMPMTPGEEVYRLKEVSPKAIGGLRAGISTCPCTRRPPLEIDGPLADCPVHGSVS